MKKLVFLFQVSDRIFSLCYFCSGYLSAERVLGGILWDFCAIGHLIFNLFPEDRMGWMTFFDLVCYHKVHIFPNPLYAWGLHKTSITVLARLFFDELHVTSPMSVKMAWTELWLGAHMAIRVSNLFCQVHTGNLFSDLLDIS